MSLTEIGEDGQIKNEWLTASPEYQRSDLQATATKFLEITDLLLERPNLNSACLFRADILSDSGGLLQTNLEKELNHEILPSPASKESDDNPASRLSIPDFADFTLDRTVIRRLIPRNPVRDQPLDQVCFLFSSTGPMQTSLPKHLAVYEPLEKPANDLPWYHPQVQAVAYLFEQHEDTSSISVHYKPLPEVPNDPPMRLHRTMLSLLQTFVRLTKLDGPAEESTSNLTSARSTAPSLIKDTVIPQHLVQDTYTRLKQTYAADLINRWVEKTEPSKHVFEDLSIAAFLIELWKQIYSGTAFPGFVDVACGNGVLVYVLIKEGYQGYGYDARRRKTWQILDLASSLEERLCIPKPFLEVMALSDSLIDTQIHDGVFPSDTFIISNHADELTPWTPILAYLSNPSSPLPFLAIPCCSHALSGARYRYTLNDINAGSSNITQDQPEANQEGEGTQPASGDLCALRKANQSAAAHMSDKSQYACLAKKVVALTEELGITAEMTLMRIPSTRNIGIVGNRKGTVPSGRSERTELPPPDAKNQQQQVDKHLDVLHRECARSGGVQAAASIWIERARKLQAGSGRGKVNLGTKPNSPNQTIEKSNP